MNPRTLTAAVALAVFMIPWWIGAYYLARVAITWLTLPGQWAFGFAAVVLVLGAVATAVDIRESRREVTR